MIRDLTIFTCTLAIIASASPCHAHSRPNTEFRRASTGEIYFQPTPPLEAKEGELWVDSRNGNQFYFLNGAWTYEDLGTSIAHGRTGQTKQMVAGSVLDNTTTTNDHSKQSHADTQIAHHEHRQSDVTALHEPRPLGPIDENDLNGKKSDIQTTSATAATAVTQAAFGNTEKASDSSNAGLDKRSQQGEVNSKSDGPHMSLTDALNADELVDLLRSIGAAH